MADISCRLEVSRKITIMGLRIVVFIQIWDGIEGRGVGNLQGLACEGLIEIQENGYLLGD